ncbi:hypothetical protein ACERIT_12190 [Halopenitus sp. H-Gu1]|uniref:hypothetical protein n=1 Tax=Halopenitus sp. H-Gu1 TaxID=3242697 RepID=UPI00359D23D2
MSNERPIKVPVSREGELVVGTNRGRAVDALIIAVDEYLNSCADRCPVVVFGLTYRLLFGVQESSSAFGTHVWDRREDFVYPYAAKESVF